MTGILGAIGTGATIGITIKAIDEFSNVFKKAEFSLGGIAKMGAGAAIAGVAVVGTAMVGLGIASVKAAGDFEQTTVAFTTMLGSAEEADLLLKDLADFARKTPFTITGIEQSAKQLMAMGIESDKLLPTLKAMGDVSAGLAVPLDRIAYNFGQVKAQGKLTGVELRDFARAGVPLIAELAKNMNVSEDQIKEMVSAGEVGFDDVEQAFISMTSAGGKFEDLMSKQAETVQGKFSNLQDTFQLILRDIGTALLPVISQLADTFLNELLPAIQPLIPMIGEFLREALEMIIPYIPQLVEYGMKFVEVSIKILQALEPLIPPLLKIVFLIIDLGIKILEYAIPTLEKLGEIAGWIIDKISILVGWIKQLVEWIGKISFGMLEKVGGFVGGTFNKVFNVDDAIIRPNGDIIKTHPDDYLIATKNPNSLGGGITILIEGNNIYGTDPDDIANALYTKLAQKISI